MPASCRYTPLLGLKPAPAGRVLRQEGSKLNIGKVSILAFSFFIFSSLGLITGGTALATYSTSLSNSETCINSPNQCKITCNGSLTIEGNSILDTVYFCLRGPQEEVEAWYANVCDGQFSTSINLRFGPGEYAIWVGDNAQNFDGSIRFLIENQKIDDIRYLASSVYVDSEYQEIAELAASIAPDHLSDEEKMTNIHTWITNNIAYDYDAYLKQDGDLVKASQVLESKIGICRDYAFLYAALARASHLPTKIVYGQTDSGSSQGLHAWNEVLVDNEWISVDSCWDAGYINGKNFIQSPSTKYLAPNSANFALTHQIIETTPY